MNYHWRTATETLGVPVKSSRYCREPHGADAAHNHPQVMLELSPARLELTVMLLVGQFLGSTIDHLDFGWWHHQSLREDSQRCGRVPTTELLDLNPAYSLIFQALKVAVSDKLQLPGHSIYWSCVSHCLVFCKPMPVCMLALLALLTCRQ